MSRITATAEKITFEGLFDISNDDLLQILKIRNEHEIRANMFTEHVISEAEHLAWAKDLEGRADCLYFAIYFENEVVGVVNLAAWTQEHRRADWAFYLSQSTRGKGLGSSVEFKFLELAFSELDLVKLNCEVIDFNRPVIALHKKFGFVEEGVRRHHLIRDGKPLDVHLLGITKSEWLASRPRFAGETTNA